MENLTLDLQVTVPIMPHPYTTLDNENPNSNFLYLILAVQASLLFKIFTWNTLKSFGDLVIDFGLPTTKYFKYVYIVYFLHTTHNQLSSIPTEARLFVPHPLFYNICHNLFLQDYSLQPLGAKNLILIYWLTMALCS